MALYVLSYDLRNRRDYQKMYDELARFNAMKVLESVWCFKRFNTNAGELRDHFSSFIDSDDRLFVAEITYWGGRNLISDPNKL